MPTVMATSIAALFFGFHYSIPLLGGKIGDYFKDYKFLLISGKLFQLLSAIILIYAIKHREFIYLGLGCYLVDSMFNNVIQSLLLTSKFNQTEKNLRQLAFLKSYLWINFGTLTAFLISGALYRLIGINSLLYVSAFFTTITITYIHFFIKVQKSCDETKNCTLLIFGMVLLALVLSLLLSNNRMTREAVLLISALFSITLLIKAFLGKYNQYSINILKFFTYMFLAVFFWSIYMLIPTFIALFIDTGVDTMIFGVNIPTQWLQTVDGITILTIGAVLSKYLHSHRIGSDRKMLFVIGISFAIFALFLLNIALSAYITGVKVSCLWIVAILVALSAGEVFLSPASMALVGDYIPKKEQGLYMGVNKMTMGVAVVCSGIITEKLLIPVATLNNKVIFNHQSTSLALILSILIIVIGYVMFDRMLNNRHNVNEKFLRNES